MDNHNLINASSGPINYAIIMAALLKSGFHWEMHSAQLMSLECLAFKSITTVTSEVTADTKEIFVHTTKNTLMGLPITIDDEKYPKSLIRLMHEEREVCRIEYLAIPWAYCYDEDPEAERRKFEGLSYKEENNVYVQRTRCGSSRGRHKSYS